MNLNDAEIDNICDGYVQSAAKVRYLERLGLVVNKKPNGRPLVNRAHYDAIMGGCAASSSEKSDCQPVWGVH